MNAIREYAAPLLLALLVHGAVAAALLRSWESASADLQDVARPRAIQAELLTMRPPKPKPKPPVAQPAPRPAPPVKPPPQTLPKPAPPKPKPPDVDAERRAAEAAKRQRLRELAEQSTAQVLKDEAQDLSASATDAETSAAVDAIYRAVRDQWSRPPSARNDMQARILVELVPSGELLQLTLLESSGNAAFDRSAEIAVRKVRRFEVPADRDLFESKFRRFTLLFKPQDLLR